MLQNISDQAMRHVFAVILFSSLPLSMGITTAPVLVAQDDWVAKFKQADDKEFIELARRVSAAQIDSPEVQKLLVEKLKTENINLRAACVDAIPYVGAASPEVINAIFDSMATREFTLPDAVPYINIGTEALVKIGEPVMPFALERIDSDNQHIYAGTMDYLHQMGSKSKAAVPRLIEKLEPGKNLWPTVFALAGIGPEATAAIDPLIELLDAPNFNTVCIACQALASIGPAARKAKPKLLEVLERGNVSERGRAMEALGGIGVIGDPDVKPLVAENLKAFHQSICDRTMMGIGLLTPEKGQQFIPMVVEAIERPAYKNKPLAAFVLHRIGGSNEMARKILEESLSNPVFEVDVIEKFGQMGPDARDSLPVLLPYLDSEDDYLRALAIRSIAKIGMEEATRSKIEEIAKQGDYLAARTAQEVLQDDAAGQ